MAKKEDVEIDLDDKDNQEDDLGFDDFPDFGDDDFPDFDDDREPTSGEIAKESLKDAGSSFLGSLIQNTAKKSLPDEYTTEISSAMDYVDIGKEIYRDSKSKLQRSTHLLTKEVTKILPFESKLLNNLVEKLAPEETYQQQSEEEQREASIQSTLSSIFDKQLEVQKALEAKKSAEDKVDRKQNLALGKINLDVLGNIDKSTSITNSFHLNISKEYFRKSLELQYKSYFVQADLLKISKEYFKTFVTQFESITKNTSLPDYVKLHNKEALAELARKQAVESIFNNVFSTGGYVEKVKKKLTSLVSEKVDDLTDVLDGVSDMLSSINEVEDPSLARNVGASLVGGVLGEKVSEKIVPKIKDKVIKNEYVRTGANYLNMLSKSPASFFSTMNEKLGKAIDENEGDVGLKSFALEKGGGILKEVLDIMEPERKSFNVKKESVLTHNKPAIFDKNVHRSITDVIPMYLRKILKETSNISRMTFEVNKRRLKSFTSSDELHYDYTNRKLDTIGNIRKTTENKLFDKETILKSKSSRVKGNIRNLISSNLSKEEKKVIDNKKLTSKFEELLVKASDTMGDDLTIKNIINESRQPKEIKDFLNDNPELNEYLNIIKKHSDGKEKDIDTSLAEFSLDYPVYGLIELFKITTKLSGSRIKNNLDKKEAVKIAKGFHTYIIETGKDITFKQILSGAAFKYIKKDSLNALLDKIKKFVSGVKTIYQTNNITKVSSFEYALSVVNSELRNMSTIDPSVFQSLYDLNPELQESGKLTTDNFIRKKIGIFKNETNSDITSELAEISSIGESNEFREMTTRTEDITASVFSNSFSYRDIKDIVAEEFKDVRSVTDLAVSIEKIARKGIEKGKKKLEGKYSEAKKTIENFNESMTLTIKNYVETSSVENIKLVKEAMLRALTDLDNKINDIISEEQKNLDTKLSELAKIKAELSESTNDPNFIAEIDKKIYNVKSKTLKEIDALKYVQKNVRIQKTKINALDVNTDDVKSFLFNIKENMDELKDSFLNIAKNLEGKD